MRALIAATLALLSCAPATSPPPPSPTVPPAATVTAVAASAPASATPRPAKPAQPIAVEAPTSLGFEVAADDGAFASVIQGPDGRIDFSVIDLANMQAHAIASSAGRFVWLGPGGALRKDLITYVEREERATRLGGAQVVTWHVMVANWRTASPPVEIDAIPGEVDPDPRANNYLPSPVTNGRDVVWMHAPRTNGQLGDADIRRWNSGATVTIHKGAAAFTIDDAGRVAIDRRGELLLVDVGGATRRIAGRDKGGTPYLAGPKVVWARAPGATPKVTAVDVVDLASGAISAVTYECAFIGATVRQVLFGCRDDGSRLVGVDDLEAIDVDDFFYRADPHAIIGRANDRWTVWPVPN